MGRPQDTLGLPLSFSSDSEIFGVMLNIVGHDHWLLLILLPILGT